MNKLEEAMMALSVGKFVICEVYNVSVDEYDNIDEIMEQYEAEERIKPYSKGGKR